MDIDLVKLTCKRCGHTWTPAKSPVVRCARCKSQHWQTERTTRQGLRPKSQTRGNKITKNKLVFTLALALAVWPGHATAQDVSDSDRFQLFNECGPMDLVVEDYGDDAGWTDIGLTVDRIQTMAESRLRVARLYDATALAYLHVNVIVFGLGLSLTVQYNKVVYDAVSGETNYATTWAISSAGTHGSDAGYILQGLSERLDRFILEYLRVNEDACDQTR